MVSQLEQLELRGTELQTLAEQTLLELKNVVNRANMLDIAVQLNEVRSYCIIMRSPQIELNEIVLTPSVLLCFSHHITSLSRLHTLMLRCNVLLIL